MNRLDLHPTIDPRDLTPRRSWRSLLALDHHMFIVDRLPVRLEEHKGQLIMVDWKNNAVAPRTLK